MGNAAPFAVIYDFLFKLILRRLPPEFAHRLAALPLGMIGRVRPLRRWLRGRLGTTDPVLAVTAFGQSFSTPLGVAAGMDKNATWYEGLGLLGFGCVEVGTATADPQPGAAGRRIERLVEARAMLNWMGFPNDGANRIASRLQTRSGDVVVGANIGKSEAVPVREAGQDYRRSVRALAPVSDYMVLNVSSPNTPGLREMQDAEILGALIADVQDELRALGLDLPLLVKLAPDLSNEDVDAIADLAIARGLAGIIATNTTTDRGGFTSRRLEPGQPAGLSGPPLKPRALEVLQRLRVRLGDQVVLVAVGGIQTADDVWERMVAGASLVQAHTGFVYGGPLWPRRINRDLARRARANGVSSVQAIVGTGAVGSSVQSAGAMATEPAMAFTRAAATPS